MEMISIIAIVISIICMGVTLFSQKYYNEQINLVLRRARNLNTYINTIQTEVDKLYKMTYDSNPIANPLDNNVVYTYSNVDEEKSTVSVVLWADRLEFGDSESNHLEFLGDIYYDKCVEYHNYEHVYIYIIGDKYLGCDHYNKDIKRFNVYDKNKIQGAYFDIIRKILKEDD